MKKHNLFPTLILEKENFLTKKQCNNIYKFIIDNKHLGKKHNAINNESVSSHSSVSNILKIIKEKVPECFNIENDILSISNDYFKETSYYGKNILDNSWFNIQTKDSILKEHTHPLCILSGVIFIKSDKQSSNICFENPNPFLKITSYKDSNNLYTSNKYCFPATTGSLLLFPSWLSHGSNNQLNKSQDRIAISFNIL